MGRREPVQFSQLLMLCLYRLHSWLLIKNISSPGFYGIVRPHYVIITRGFISIEMKGFI